MDVKEMNVAEATITTIPVAAKTTTITNPTVVMTQMASKEYLKILELTEYCKIAQFTLKECENKIQMLVSAKNEAMRLKIEYLTRDKINITNFESLLQAKNELFQYKCELKSKYVAIEKAAKTKKLHYEKLLSSYETDWQKALGEYESNTLVKELNDIRRTSAFAEKNIEKQERLISFTEIQMLELERKIRETFLNKIVEFSQEMIQYEKFILLQKNHGAKHEGEYSLMPQKNGQMKFSKSVIPAFGQNSSFNREDISIYPGVDVSVFDQLMVPTENLECQNEEEELFNLIQNQNVQMGEDDEDEEERAKIDVNDYHQPEEQDETQINTEGSAKQNIEKTAKEENESQYFRTQGPECLKQRTAQNTAVENWGSNIENSLPLAGMSKGNNDKICNEDNVEINRQNESEKSISEASFDNQNIYSREAFEYMYNKTHSVSSEDMPLSGDNTNESFGSPHKIINIEQTNIFKLQDDQEREESKSFENFFAINSDKNSAKPSIFKLF